MTRESPQELAIRLGLEYGVDVVCKHDAIEKDKWNIFITRNGYRRVASSEPDYLRHVVYPIYDNTEIVVDGDCVKVSISGRKANIVGAMGFLWKTETEGPFSWQIDMDDYEHLDGPYWKRMRVTMLCKICEVGLLRLAYPSLFSGTYSPEEFISGEHESEDLDGAVGKEKTPTKQDMMTFIRENISLASPFLEQYDVTLESLTVDEVYSVYIETKNKKETDE